MPNDYSRLDPECRLALAYVGAARRDSAAALFALDAALGALVAGGSQPMVTQIKIAWWRDALARLDSGPPPAEPMLERVAARLIPVGITGAELGTLADGWEHLLSPEPLVREDLDAFAILRGGRLFGLAARALGGVPSPQVERAGEAWALADLARRSRNAEDRAAALDAARQRLGPDARWPAPLRPLGMLARLARRDAARGPGRIERQGSPPRMLAMLAHRLTGR